MRVRKIIKFSKKDLKGLFCLEDFYKKLVPEMHDKDTKIKDVRQVRANEKTLDEVYDIFRQNIMISKDKRVSKLTEYGRKNVSAMDWLCYAPYTSNTAEDFTLEILW